MRCPKCKSTNIIVHGSGFAHVRQRLVDGKVFNEQLQGFDRYEIEKIICYTCNYEQDDISPNETIPVNVNDWWD